MINPTQYRRPTATPSQLVHQLLRAAWRRDYVAVPRDTATSRPTVLLTPRAGVQSDRRGRLHLAHDTDGVLRWHWSDTDEPLKDSPTAVEQLLDEIDAQLLPGRQAR
jgi:hypothetical protein